MSRKTPEQLVWFDKATKSWICNETFRGRGQSGLEKIGFYPKMTKTERFEEVGTFQAWCHFEGIPIVWYPGDEDKMFYADPQTENHEFMLKLRWW